MPAGNADLFANLCFRTMDKTTHFQWGQSFDVKLWAYWNFLNCFVQEFFVLNKSLWADPIRCCCQKNHQLLTSKEVGHVDVDAAAQLGGLGVTTLRHARVIRRRVLFTRTVRGRQRRHLKDIQHTSGPCVGNGTFRLWTNIGHKRRKYLETKFKGSSNFKWLQNYPSAPESCIPEIKSWTEGQWLQFPHPQNEIGTWRGQRQFAASIRAENKKFCCIGPILRHNVTHFYLFLKTTKIPGLWLHMYRAQKNGTSRDHENAPGTHDCFHGGGEPKIKGTWHPAKYDWTAPTCFWLTVTRVWVPGATTNPKSVISGDSVWSCSSTWKMGQWWQKFLWGLYIFKIRPVCST